MFLRLASPRTVVLCLDGLIERGDLPDDHRATIRSIAQLDELVAVSYRRYKEAEEWLALNPLGMELRDLVCTPGAWRLPPISDVLKKLSRQPCEAIAVCSDGLEISHAHTVGVGAVLVTTAPPGPLPHSSPFLEGPDFVFRGGDDASALYNPDSLAAGNVAEVVAAREVIPRLRRTKSLLVAQYLFVNQEAPEAPIQVLGRYFKTTDPRHHLHPLSLRLINAKRQPGRQTPLMVNALSHWIRVRKPGSSILTCVPQREGQAQSSVALAVKTLRLSEITSAPDLLTCVRAYSPQKEAGSYSARRENVRGAFEVTRSITGQKVLVVDDITTSFSTLNEARATLMAGGAKDVVPIAISFHPNNISAGPETRLPTCKTCGHSTTVRFRKDDGEPFIACDDFEAYSRGEKHEVLRFGDVYEQAIRTPP